MFEVVSSWFLVWLAEIIASLPWVWVGLVQLGKLGFHTVYETFVISKCTFDPNLGAESNHLVMNITIPTHLLGPYDIVSQISYVATLLKDREMAYWKMIEKIIIDQ